jgi:hypothetical protein
MKKPDGKKLALHRETLVSLDPDVLDGGLSPVPAVTRVVCPIVTRAVCPQVSQLICTKPNAGGAQGGK